MATGMTNGGDTMPANERGWPYWTRNKLEILGGYLPAFNIAATKSPERLYIDLMAGQPVNRDAETGEELDGSPRLALSADPRFTRLAFCELPGQAVALERDLRQRYPGRSFQVYPGDCNKSIDCVLHDLREYSWAPTFVFADQHAAEIHWETLRKVAAFKRVKEGATKAEIWLLVSAAETIRGATGTNNEGFADRVDLFYGNDDWRRIQWARDEKSGRMALFDLEPASVEIETLTWEPENSWDPGERSWW